MNAYEKVLRAQAARNSALCVGLDFDLVKMPDHLSAKGLEGALEFNKKIIEATADLACAYKLNFAFYERFGAEGYDLLKKTFDYVPDDVLTIADAKRGDIANTSKGYAHAAFDFFGADALTVNPYMGMDSVIPYLNYTDKLVFLLVLTTNPGANDFQGLTVDDEPLYKHVFRKSLDWADKTNLGFVAGANHPRKFQELRMEARDRIFLIPGIGAQGGDLVKVLDANCNGTAIINASRGIIYASAGEDFAEKAREQSEYYLQDIRKYYE